MTKHIMIFCTVPDEVTADKIATVLVENQLAACCSIVPQIRSIYRWQDKVEAQDEYLVIIKSSDENYKQIEQTILKNHPYDIPEILAVKVEKGEDKYLNWINQSTRASYGQ